MAMFRPFYGEGGWDEWRTTGESFPSHWVDVKDVFRHLIGVTL